MYAMTMTRLDLRYALFVLSRYCANLDVTHIKTTIRVLRYVKETLSYSTSKEKHDIYSLSESVKERISA